MQGFQGSRSLIQPIFASENAWLRTCDESGNAHDISTLQLTFSRDELTSYTKWRKAGLDRKSSNWINKAAEIVWKHTRGAVSKETIDAVRNYALTKYQSVYSKRKVLYFSKGILKYLTKTSFDTRFQAFELFLEMPKALKTHKLVTNRIVTKEDIQNLLEAIERAHVRGLIDLYHYLNYKAIVLLGAFTGQRPLATIARLKIGQLRAAVDQEKPVLNVLPEQDKIRMQHYCPLHPQVVEVMLPLLDGRRDDEFAFAQLSFQQWLRYNEVHLLHSEARIVNGDLRKFAEQYGDIIQWDQSNRAYILTHGVRGVEWSNYRHPLPDDVYDVYMKYWRDVDLTP